MEKATSTRRGGRSEAPESPLDIPQFRSYLKKAGLTYEQWLAAQPRPDLDSEILNLARRRLTLKGKAK